LIHFAFFEDYHFRLFSFYKETNYFETANKYSKISKKINKRKKNKNQPLDKLKPKQYDLIEVQTNKNL